MRIAIIVDTFPSLSETFISNKAAALAARGHTVLVFCNKVNTGLLNSQGSELTRVHVERFTLAGLFAYLVVHPFAVFQRVTKISSLRQKLLRLYRSHRINRQRPEIIHFEFSGIGIEYLAEMERLEGKKVVSCRGTAEKVKLLLYPERQQKFRQLMQQADAVHCVSEDMRKTILPYCSGRDKLFINRPSINPQYFRRAEKQPEDGIPILLSVGRLTFQKGHLHGLHAMKLLQQAGVAFNWVIVGQGNKFEELVFQTHLLGLRGQVKLIGFGSNQYVRELMQQATVFFLPSVYEGIANVVLEAMSMELPVVATRCGGMNEVIDHETNGLLADVYDPFDMASQLRRLLADTALRKRFAEKGREKIAASFTLDQQITVFEQVYQRLTPHAAKREAYAI